MTTPVFQHSQYASVIVLLTLITSCESLSSATTQGRPGPGFHKEPIDFIGVTFKPKHPYVGEVLETAVSTSDDINALEHDLRLFEQFPADVPLKVVAFTDAQECVGIECAELSLRRAQSVHDWLIGRGVPAKRLSAPRGYGSERPIEGNETEEGRARNRRAYVSYEGGL